MSSQAPGHTPPPTVAPGSRSGSWSYPARISRAGGDGSDLTFAVIPAPTYPIPARTLQRRTDAIAATYTGRWEEAGDLYRQTVGEDGFFDGILRTMSQGILGLPTSFQGDAEIVSALDDADGTPSDYARMHPLEECAKIFEDGCGLGLGLGQYLLMCWRCDYTDHDRVQSHETGRVWEVCRRCDATRTDRPAGLRELFQLQWRDPRWLWQNTISYRWYYTARDGLIPIVDGDGEWFMFRTVPGLEPWRHGPWIWATLAAIFSRDAQYDAQNTSSVCAPTPVLRALKPTGPEARREAERKMENLAFDNRFVLDGEWIYEIVSASADYREICETIVARCSESFETGLTGVSVGRKPDGAFQNMSIFNRTTRERRAFYAGAWHRQIREKGLVWYTRDNFPGRVAPVSVADVRSPEDKKAASTALKEEGDGLKALREGLDAMGLEAEPQWVLERLQRLGIRARPKAGNENVSKLDLGVDAVAAVVRGGPALASLGLQPFGDKRDDMTIAELAAAAGQGGGAPATDAPQAPQPPPAPDDEPAARDDGGVHGAAERAAAMNAHEMTACRHGRANVCPHCGVRGHWMPVKGGGWSVTWEPIEGPRARGTAHDAHTGQFTSGSGGGGAHAVSSAHAIAKIETLREGNMIPSGKVFAGVVGANDPVRLMDFGPVNKKLETTPITTTSTEGLIALHRAVNADGVQQKLNGGARNNPIQILEMDGKRYLLDGHHGAAAAILRGDKHIKAQVVTA